MQNIVCDRGSVEHLQNHWRLNYGCFYSLRALLWSPAAIEREKVRLDNKFQEILKLWNAPTAQK